MFGVIVLVSGHCGRARRGASGGNGRAAHIDADHVLYSSRIAAPAVRRPGPERLAAGVALFGMVNVPFVKVRKRGRKVHPLKA